MTTALLIGGGALLGGVGTAIASDRASSTQADAAQTATAVQQQNFERTRNDLLPYNVGGRDATAALYALLGLTPGGNPMQSALLSPFNPTQAQLESTPGYQFTRNQGLKSVQNSMAARGHGISGNALRGAADYATGLADQTFGQNFDRYQTQQFNMYNRLMGLSQLGENAGAQTGAYGTQTSGQVGSNIIGGANATAAGQIGVANSLAGIPGNALNTLLAARLTGIYGG